MNTSRTRTLVLATGLALSVGGPVLAQRELEQVDRRAALQQLAEQRAQAQNEGAAPDGVVPDVNNPDPDRLIDLTAFPEEVALDLLVEYVADYFQLNIQVQVPVSATFTLKKGREVREDELLPLLQEFLDASDFAISYNPRTDIYVIEPAGVVRARTGEELATFEFIPTPGIRPNALSPFIDQAIGQNGGNVNYMDEMGGILITASPLRIEMVKQAIELALEQINARTWEKFDLRYVSASYARDNLPAFLSGGSASAGGRTAAAPNRNNPAATGGGAAAAASGGAYDSIAARLRVSPDGNALLVHGVAEEFERIRNVLRLVDTPNTLESRVYFAGSSAQQIAQIASARGLGEVQDFGSVSSTARLGVRQPGDPAGNNPLSAQLQQAGSGGSVMVVDSERGQIVYYATPEQHAELAKLVDELEADLERVVIREYKLEHIDAATVSDLINQLIGQQSDEDGSLLPNQQPDPNRQIVQLGGGDGELSLMGIEDVTVVADEQNNQLIVQAPAGKQADFERLIGKIDQRRPQVWLEVQIVSVSETEDFELAFDTQIINSGGSGGAFQTGNNVIAGGLLTPATLGAPAAGVTAGVVLSEYVPFALSAAASATGATILSTPKLLVDDNEEATINNVEQQPTTETTLDGNGNQQTSFSGFEDAGTQLTITPRISAGGYLQLDYQIVLSSFLGESSNGIPSPRLETELASGGVTIPSDSTIVVGGIVNQTSTTGESGIPWLKDLPVFGSLFKTQSEGSSNTKLYVFITPRVMRDPDFRDLRLNSLGPQAEVNVEPDVPTIEPAIISVTRFAAESGLGPVIQDRRGVAPVPVSTPEITEQAPEPIVPLIEDEEPEPEPEPGVIRRRRVGGDG
ncbi:MAG: secretin N-terminal domain-containing protein [Planctomycetota bacterium]